VRAKERARASERERKRFFFCINIMLRRRHVTRNIDMIISFFYIIIHTSNDVCSFLVHQGRLQGHEAQNRFSFFDDRYFFFNSFV